MRSTMKRRFTAATIGAVAGFVALTLASAPLAASAATAALPAPAPVHVQDAAPFGAMKAIAGPRIKTLAVATSGSGRYLSSIDWVDWGTDADQTLSSGATSVSTQMIDGMALVRTCTLTSPVSLKTYRPGTWRGDGLPELYGPAASRLIGLRTSGTVTSADASGTVTCSVTFNGTAVAMQGLVVADAEELSSDDWYQVSGKTAAGVVTPMRLIDRYNDPDCVAPYDWAYVPSTGTVRVSLEGTGVCNTVSLTTKGESAVLLAQGASSVTFSMENGNLNALAVGVLLNIDFGDAPASYGQAGAIFTPTWSGGTFSSLVGAVVRNTAVATQTAPTLRLGSRVDADGNPVHNATATADDTTVNGATGTPSDEDAVTISGVKTVARGSTFSQAVTCTGTGAVSGWIDWNANGVFDNTAERATGTCTNGAGVTLTWGVPWDAPDALPTFMRLRIASTAAQITSPTGLSTTGEVEDHAITFTVTGRPPLQVCSTDDASANAGQWRFGSGAGIDFSGATATAVVGLPSPTPSSALGAFTVNDENGELVFWVSGQGGNVYNRTGGVITSVGTGAAGTQHVAALPAGRDTGLFYIISSNSSGLRWTLIDVMANGGTGAVVSGPTSFGTTAGGAIYTVPNHDGTGWWAVVPDASGDVIRSYRFTASTSGPQQTATSLSGTGSGLSSVQYSAITFSSDLTQAATIQSFGTANQVRLLSFDAQNGTFALIGSPVSYTGFRGYSVAFSPSGDYLYTTEIQGTSTTGMLRRYPVTDTGLGTVQNYGTLSASSGAIQRGPDGRMYIARNGQTTMHVVTTPDAATIAGIGFVSDGFTLASGTTSGWMPPLTLTDCITLPKAELQITKASSADAVAFGSAVGYTITVTNTGTATDSAVKVLDDLADVLDDASFVTTPPPTAVFSGVAGATTPAAPVFNAAAKTLSWNGALRAGETVTISYAVTTVSAPTTGVHTGSNRLENTVCLRDAAGAIKLDAAGAQLCAETLTRLPGWWDLAKTAYAVTGAAADGTGGTAASTPLTTGATVMPGTVIEYRVTTQVRAGSVVRPVVTDDLSGVLGEAAPVGNVTVHYALPGGATTPDENLGTLSAVLVGDMLNVTHPADPANPLSVSGIPSGTTITLAYRVRVDDTHSVELRNEVTGIAVDEDGDPLPPQTCAGDDDEPAAQCSTTQFVAAVLLLHKVGDGVGGAQPLDGSAFAVHQDAGGVPASVADPALPVTPTGAVGAFTIVGLVAGQTYWLFETVAPEGHELLAEPVAFQVDATGHVILADAAANPQVETEFDDVERVATVWVRDAKSIPLPMAGGSGDVPYRLAAAALVVCALFGAAAIACARRRAAVSGGPSGRC
ncbi:CshA/CshB family fibrillar adhesin-related protein [Microbacterium sp.]|uniref:CshA/CshB family fibrillar adhesin-related protein n=1 Tax=Microbacterium sp. TaxID=51671 RepID=UPI0039E6E122